MQLVIDIFASFRVTLWSAVDVEFMTDLTKKLQKEVKLLPRPMHKWNVHQGLTSALMSMSVSLPLVQDLRDEAMRPRHWTQLMQACGKAGNRISANIPRGIPVKIHRGIPAKIPRRILGRIPS